MDRSSKIAETCRDEAQKISDEFEKVQLTVNELIANSHVKESMSASQKRTLEKTKREMEMKISIERKIREKGRF